MERNNDPVYKVTKLHGLKPKKNTKKEKDLFYL